MEVKTTWDDQFDVVIVGHGGAGTAAAITAHDMGAKVIILEKMSISGGNSRLSGANIGMPRYPQEFPKFAEYLKAVCFKTTEPEIIDTYVNGLKELPDWFRAMGGELAENIALNVPYSFVVFHPTYPGISLAKGLDMSEQALPPNEKWPGLSGGARFWDLMDIQMKKRNIKVMLSTPVKELVQNEKGEIVGVIAESEGKPLSIRARKAVIMTCGGFQNNEALKQDNLEPKPVGFMGSPGNTGDGIKIVQKVGAALWHMSRHVTGFGFKAPEFESSFFIYFLAPGFIYVDKRGRRFASETKSELHNFGDLCRLFDIEHYDYPRAPFYAIFDEEVRRIGPLSIPGGGYNAVVKKYSWSLDNSVEIERGWIKRAKSLSELANILSIDAKNLENTISRYNDFCKAGQDADFNRPKEALKAIKGPPFYAIPLLPSMANTQGGARRDKEARVINVDGKPIPRLYSAGEFGSIWGFLNEAGTNFAESLIFGRIAGKNAASLPSQE
jgi:succinate dehydrogenase/fumarate reductase flavoprotein subunit